MSELRGKLKIYLGYAAGAGKTWHMPDDAQHLRTQGCSRLYSWGSG
jgi:K+-sensing histidine kinase KdpD